MKSSRSCQCLLMIFAINIYILRIEGDLECYNGTVTSGPTVGLIKCPKIVSVNGTISSRHTSSGPLNNSTRSIPKLPGQTIEKAANFCTIFRHISSSTSLKFHHLSFVTFACDNRNICNGKPVNTFTEVSIGDRHGEVYCCNTSSCNLPQLTPLPKQALKCYHAKKPGSGYVVGCQHGNGLCASSTEFQEGGGVKQQFFCDSQHICAKANVTTTGCANITLNHKSRVKICCCADNYCNKPPWNITETPRMNGTRSPIQASKPYTDWLLIGGFIAFLLLVAGIIIGAVVILKRCKTKDTNGTLQLSYRRLRADRLEDSCVTDNVQLLVT